MAGTGDIIEVGGIAATESVVLSEIGIPAIIIGKVTSIAGTGLEIADDFQRLDPELAQQNLGIRLSIMAIGELGGEAIESLAKKEIVNNFTRTAVEASIKTGEKVAENTYTK